MKLLNSIVAATLLTAMGTSALMAAKVPTPEVAPKGVKIATYQDVIDVFHKGGEVFDVRWHYSEYEFEGHIPFAKSVPFTEWSGKNTNYDIKKDTWDWKVLPQDKKTPIAFYCMGVNCWKSYKLADTAKKMGYSNVFWYKGGQPEWDKLGLPNINHNETYIPMQKLFSSKEGPVSWIIEPAILDQWLSKGEKVKVIDFRYLSFFEEGRIKTASQVEIKDLLSRDGIQLMPKPQEKYKIVLVSETGVQAATAASALKLLGYDVYVLNGGMKAWSKKMNKKHVVKGPLDQNWPGKKGWQSQVFKLPVNK